VEGLTSEEPDEDSAVPDSPVTSPTDDASPDSDIDVSCSSDSGSSILISEDDESSASDAQLNALVSDICGAGTAARSCAKKRLMAPKGGKQYEVLPIGKGWGEREEESQGPASQEGQ